MKLIGWLGGILLGISVIPQSIQTYRTKDAKSFNSGMLWMWLVGEICTMIYVFPTLNWPLILNYSINFTGLSVIIYYKLREYFK